MCQGVSVYVCVFICHSSAAKEQISLTKGLLEFICVYACVHVCMVVGGCRQGYQSVFSVSSISLFLFCF